MQNLLRKLFYSKIFEKVRLEFYEKVYLEGYHDAIKHRLKK